MNKPYAWVPSVMPFQLLRIGNLFIIATSTELTTMAGRRLRKAVVAELQMNKILASDEKIYVVIAGLANSYQSYTTTYEEYQAQRYEAASTLFGPHQLDGMIQEFVRLAYDISTDRPSDTDSPPLDLLSVQWELTKSPLFDTLPTCSISRNNDKNNSSNILIHSEIGTTITDTTTTTSANTITIDDVSCVKVKYGDVVNNQNTKSSYEVNEIVDVQFYGANPRHRLTATTNNNNNNTSSSLISIQRLLINNNTNEIMSIRQVADENDWSTKFIVHTASKPHVYSQAVVSYVSIKWDLYEAKQHELSSLSSSTTTTATAFNDYQNTNTIPHTNVKHINSDVKVLKSQQLPSSVSSHDSMIVTKYRICYNGLAKPSAKETITFTGCSSHFIVNHQPVQH